MINITIYYINTNSGYAIEIGYKLNSPSSKNHRKMCDCMKVYKKCNNKFNT